MLIYTTKNNNATALKEIKVDLESDIQKFVEKNIKSIFGLQFVSSEFIHQNFRIDTLAFNEETNSFVIIEYKKDRSFSIVDQGYAYLAQMLSDKGEFILEYNEKTGGSLTRTDVDWSQSRVIFIARSFTQYQTHATSFKDMPFELWEARFFENDIFTLNNVQSKQLSDSVQILKNTESVQKVNREIKNNTLETIIKNDWKLARELFDLLQPRILETDSRLGEKYTKNYIGFNIGNSNVITIHARTDKLLMDLVRMQPSDFNDPQQSVKYRENSMEQYNVHISRFEIKDASDVEYAIFLLKQVLKKCFA